jgi:hypothetical protein
MADTLTRISPYAERLLDDYIYDELDDAGRKLRTAYSRVSRRKKIDDPHALRLVRDAADSVRNAALAAAGREPEPRRRLPRILVAGAVTAGTVVLVKRLSRAERSG